MKESTAWLLTSAMEDVVKKGTGTNVRLTEVDMPVAGKTGSTSNYNDLWFSGFSPYYTATIWSGFDNNRTQTDKAYPRKIWKTIMEQIHIKKALEKKDFTMPDSIVAVKICAKSGKLAVPGLCDKYEGGDYTRIEYFAKGTEPTEKCDVHVKVPICTESNALATDNCPTDLVKEKIYLNKTETGKTDDSPYILPSKTCPIHKKAQQTPPATNSATQPSVNPADGNPTDDNSTGGDPADTDLTEDELNNAVSDIFDSQY
jgi:penicillin-binding protein 1A